MDGALKKYLYNKQQPECDWYRYLIMSTVVEVREASAPLVDPVCRCLALVNLSVQQHTVETV